MYKPFHHPLYNLVDECLGVVTYHKSIKFAINYEKTIV